MSLLTDMMFDCILMNQSTQNDGYGGFVTEWMDGAKFKAAIKKETSVEAKIAEKQGVTDVYIIGTEKNFKLEYHNVFRRIKDNKIFRVTSKGDDKETPEDSTLNLRLVSAEEWNLPNG